MKLGMIRIQYGCQGSHLENIVITSSLEWKSHLLDIFTIFLNLACIWSLMKFGPIFKIFVITTSQDWKTYTHNLTL